jgi:hypothetical protein
MAGTTLSHGYYMPISEYLKKNEITCLSNFSIEDDENLLNMYNRQTLKDFRESPSIFEQDSSRRDNYSREKLTLRHTGSRSGIEPWLPEGSFIDYAFLNNMGDNTLPDFKNLREQIDMRIREVPLYTDEDYSVPSKEKSAYEAIQQRDKLYRQAQKRIQIFDTSFDYMRMPTNIGKPLQGGIQLSKHIQTQTPDFMAEEASSNRNWQVEMSNTTPVGWQSTPDNVFKVSRYDTPRKMADQTVDSYNNRIGGKLDTDFLVSFEGKNIPRSIALTIMEIMRQRRRVANLSKTSGTQYGKSNEDTNRIIKQLDSQMMELMRRYSNQSAAPSANQLLKAERNNVSGKRYMQKDDPYKKYKTVVGFQLADMMKKATTNRKLGKMQSDDLRNQIVKTATTDELHYTDSNKKNIQFDESNKMLWESLTQHKKDEQMTVFNYANVKGIRKRSQMAGSQGMFVVDEYDRLEHPELNNKKIINQNKLYLPNVVNHEELQPLDVPMWNLGGIGKTNRGVRLTDEDNSYDVNMSEVSSRMHSQPSRIASIR